MKTSDLLKQYGIKLKKNLGQNFLSNTEIARQIVEVANVKADDVILEIGPGAGTLTEELLKTGAKVVGVEIDKRLKPLLERLNEFENFTLVFEDFLKFDISTLPKHFRVVSNIPYSITGPILKKLLFSDFSDAYLMVQKEVGERLLAPIGDSNRSFLTVVVQTFCTVEKVLTVSKGNFVPNPKVDSVVLHISKNTEVYEKYDIKIFWDFVSKCFGQKRKTLYNNLKTFVNNLDDLKKKYDLTLRPEQVSKEMFLQIFEELLSPN
ncbi:16S rRNA (adenine(1518)-N(6)/adenine(1519)-N(6))-dimethyltransferase RsmA [Thermosipho atlanticus]|uniref:Ribosomal RNA small subunit methyltransferase A n=1 Tax=Thermosipho atlanticus DSM 15807 TaxID=1123380 RepID=A0A1M5RVE6_9BACT|nr:16S rRNA (adenine(1518)-N(6)/adenine(1519)-N(6))-dimethyltransferase RsmA [Thermosipho atlanticus]SHH30292.1 dimethyladenosine transferase [Thermosipho atlanticus DSM 15807]